LNFPPPLYIKLLFVCRVLSFGGEKILITTKKGKKKTRERKSTAGGED